MNRDCIHLISREYGEELKGWCTHPDCISRLKVPYIECDASTGFPLCPFFNDVQECPFHIPFKL